MKTCNCCGKNKPDTEYYVNSRGALKQPCKPCASTKRRAQRTEHRALTAKIIGDYYGGFKCQRCGFKGHPAQFDCHHREPGTKDFAISNGRKIKDTKKLKEELAKCDLLCSNCHRLEHLTY